ncbi:MAG: hypothetical protein LBM64_04250 [Deltaproteobacteria bacterium]|nr:hypothetical protein [Deltaproteobacteria bacterium]
MQKRYCSCGQSIWVDYHFFGAMCSPRFLGDVNPASHAAGKAAPGQEGALLECPHCKSLLTINTLF